MPTANVSITAFTIPVAFNVFATARHVWPHVEADGVLGPCTRFSHGFEQPRIGPRRHTKQAS